MREWMKKHKVLGMLLVLVVSPVLIPALLIYIFLDTTVDVINIFIEQLEDWWNE